MDARGNKRERIEGQREKERERHTKLERVRERERDSEERHPLFMFTVSYLKIPHVLVPFAHPPTLA